MKDVNQEIISAIQQDFKFGLFDRIPKIIELADNMRKAVKKEQSFDAAGLIYRPMYKELARLVDYYSQNENELFANTMRNWASLAGFHGSSNKSGVITYSANSFVPKSAINALLILRRQSKMKDCAAWEFVPCCNGICKQVRCIADVLVQWNLPRFAFLAGAYTMRCLWKSRLGC